MTGFFPVLGSLLFAFTLRRPNHSRKRRSGNSETRWPDVSSHNRLVKLKTAGTSRRFQRSLQSRLLKIWRRRPDPEDLSAETVPSFVSRSTPVFFFFFFLRARLRITAHVESWKVLRKRFRPALITAAPPLHPKQKREDLSSSH